MPLRRAQLVLAPAVLVTAGASAAMLPTAGPDRPRLVLGTSAPLFTGPGTQNLRPGDRLRSCTSVRNAGGTAAAVALYARGAEGGLAPFLELIVARGESNAADCAGFVPRERLFAGRLSEFPQRLDDALVDSAVLAPNETRGLRFDLALVDDPAAAGRKASWSWRLAVDAQPAAAASRACARASARRDRVIRTRRLSDRVSAVLVLRGFGRPGADRLALTTGLRVRGRTLLIPRWARVGYRVNGRLHPAGQRRPFRARVAPGDLRPGLNRVAVTVRPRRSAPRTVRFDFRVARHGGDCVVR